MISKRVLCAVRSPLFSLLFLVLVLIGPTTAFAAVATAIISISPSSGTRDVGASFPLDFKIDTGGQAVGGVSVDVTYSSNLEFVTADAAGSVFDQEVVAPTPQNNAFSFIRVRFDNGFTGPDGQLLKVTFKALAAGQGTVTITKSTSEAIATADFSNILKDVNNAVFTIQAPASGGGTGGGGSVSPAPSSGGGGGGGAAADPHAGHVMSSSGGGSVGGGGASVSTPTSGGGSSVGSGAGGGGSVGGGPTTAPPPSSQLLPSSAPPSISLCFAANLKYGLKASNDVAKLQKALNLAGVYPANILSGNFYTLTLRAVINFQKKYGISPAVGFVGPITRGRLNAIYCSTAKPPAALPPTPAPAQGVQQPSPSLLLKKPIKKPTIVKVLKKVIIR